MQTKSIQYSAIKRPSSAQKYAVSAILLRSKYARISTILHVYTYTVVLVRYDGTALVKTALPLNY